jgi:ribonuclease P protein component
MIADKYRLKRKESFQRVEKEGKIFQSDSFGVAYYLRGDKETSSFGVIVSKKISGEAAMRNRIKRAIFEAVRQSWIDVKSGFDVVFLVKMPSLRKSTEELMRETKVALKEAGVMN